MTSPPVSRCDFSSTPTRATSTVRDTDAVARLFTADGRLVAHFHPGARRVAHGAHRSHRDRRRAGGGLGPLPRRRRTWWVARSSTSTDERARGETVCLAHHVYERDGVRRLLVMAVRYQDDFVCESGTWRFAERQLRLDWRDDRPMAER